MPKFSIARLLIVCILMVHTSQVLAQEDCFAQTIAVAVAVGEAAGKPSVAQIRPIVQSGNEAAAAARAAIFAAAEAGKSSTYASCVRGAIR